MLYEAYLKIQALTYPEFVNAFVSGTTKNLFSIIVTAIVFFFIGKISQYSLEPEEKRKLKQISKWEKRPLRYQVKHILEMFLEHYTSKHEINWDEINY